MPACLHVPVGEKLSETSAPDVRALCTTLLNAYLIQLLDTGLLHADPHPGARGGAVTCCTARSEAACYACRLASRLGGTGGRRMGLAILSTGRI